MPFEVRPTELHLIALKGAMLGCIMVDFQLDEMQAMLKELAHEFAQDEIRPHAEHWDETAHYLSLIHI